MAGSPGVGRAPTRPDGYAFYWVSLSWLIVLAIESNA